MVLFVAAGFLGITLHYLGNRDFQLEMDHFSECVQANKEPLTPGEEGLKDLKIIEAIYESARTGKPIKLA
jgi:predicted dehydrogenase